MPASCIKLRRPINTSSEVFYGRLCYFPLHWKFENKWWVVSYYYVIIIIVIMKKLLASSCYGDKVVHFFVWHPFILLCPVLYFYDIFLFQFEYIAYKISIHLLIVFCDSIRVAPFYLIVFYLCLSWGHSYECSSSIYTLLIHDCFHVLRSYSYKSTAKTQDAHDDHFFPVNGTTLLIFVQNICQFWISSFCMYLIFWRILLYLSNKCTIYAKIIRFL